MMTEQSDEDYVKNTSVHQASDIEELTEQIITKITLHYFTRFSEQW